MIDDRNFEKYLDRHEIEESVQQLAQKISEDYKGETVVIVGVLKGAFMFMADLVRRIDNDSVEVHTDFVRLHTYKKEKNTGGTVTLLQDISCDIQDKHVIILEQIIDSGRKLKFLYDRLKYSEPKSIEVMTLFDKANKRVTDVPVKYVGRTISDPFLVGYGLDLEEECRNEADMYYLKYPN